MGVHRRPIAAICLTPAKRDQAVVRCEWLGEAGTVHDTKAALTDLSCGKRQTICSPANRRGKAPSVAEEGALRPTVLSGPARPRVSTSSPASSLLSQTHAIESSMPSLADAIKSIRLPAAKILPLHQPCSIALICASCRCQLSSMPACDGIAYKRRQPIASRTCRPSHMAR